MTNRAPEACCVASGRVGLAISVGRPLNATAPVQDILVGCGMSQTDYSIAGGRVFHIPQVVSVVRGPPASLDIRILPGQMPDDFAAHARTIAYNLDVAEVRVVPLGPYLIRLELLPKPDSGRSSVPGSQAGHPPAT
jgi:hypothetical protein